MWVGLVQSAEGPERTKCGERRIHPFPASLLELGQLTSPSPGLRLATPGAPLGLQAQAEPHHRLPWVSSLQTAVMGLLSPHNCMS